MAFPIAEFIHADVLETVQTVRIDVVLDDTIDDVADSTPRDAHKIGDRCLVSDLCQVSDLLLKRTGESTVVPGPRHQFNEYAACRTLRPSWGVLENNRRRGQGKMDPAGRFLPPVVTGANPPTYRASRSKPRRSYTENKAATSKSNEGDNYTGDLYQNSGKLIHAHVFSGDLSCSGHKTSGETCAFSYCVATLRDCRSLAA